MEAILQQQKITNNRLLRIENKILDIRNNLPKLFDSLTKTLESSFVGVEKMLFGVSEEISITSAKVNASITALSTQVDKSFKKLNEDLEESFNVLKSSIDNQTETVERSEHDVSEKELENIRREESTIKLLEKIEENTSKVKTDEGMDLGDIAQLAGAFKNPLGIFAGLVDGIVGILKGGIAALIGVGAMAMKLVAPLLKLIGGGIIESLETLARVLLRLPPKNKIPKPTPNAPVPTGVPDGTKPQPKPQGKIGRAIGAARATLGGIARFVPGGPITAALALGKGVYDVMDSGELDKSFAEMDFGKISKIMIGGMANGLTMGLVSSESVQAFFDGINNNEWTAKIADIVFSTLDGSIFKGLTEKMGDFAKSLGDKISTWASDMLDATKKEIKFSFGVTPETDVLSDEAKNRIEENRKKKIKDQYSNGARQTGSTSNPDNERSLIEAYKIAVTSKDPKALESVISIKSKLSDAALALANKELGTSNVSVDRKDGASLLNNAERGRYEGSKWITEQKRDPQSVTVDSSREKPIVVMQGGNVSQVSQSSTNNIVPGMGGQLTAFPSTD